MNKTLFLLITVLLLATLAHSQTIQSSNYGTKGYIRTDGTVQDNKYTTVGYVRKNGTVQNSSYTTLIYVRDDGTVQDHRYSTIGYARGLKKKATDEKVVVREFRTTTQIK